MTQLPISTYPPTWMDIDAGQPLLSDWPSNMGLAYHLPAMVEADLSCLIDLAGLRLQALGPTWKFDHDQWCLNFDGTAGQYINTTGRLLPASDFSIFVRFKCSQTDGTERVLVGQYADAATGRFVMGVNRPSAGAGKTSIFVGDSAGEVVGATYSTTEWNDFVVVRSGNQWLLYLNGTLSNSETHAQGVDQGVNTAIGQPSPSDGTFGRFIGQMSNIRVWHRALSAPEVADLSHEVPWAGINLLENRSNQIEFVASATTPKTLWLLASDLKLWKFDGDRWTTVVTTNPANSSGDWARAAEESSLFTHNGQLWIRCPFTNSTSMIYARFDGVDAWTYVSQSVHTGAQNSSIRFPCSNFINYQGSTIALGHQRQNASYNYMVGPANLNAITGYGIYNDISEDMFDNANESSSQRFAIAANGMMQRIELFEDQILIGPSGSCPRYVHIHAKTALYRDIYRLRLNVPTSTGVLTNLNDELVFDQKIRDSYTVGSSSTWTATSIDDLERPVAYLPWNGDVYYITVQWKLMKCDGVTKERSMIHDFQNEAALQVRSGATFTTTATRVANANYSLYSDTNDASGSGQTSWSQFMFGNRVTINNYDGLGDPQVGWIDRQHGYNEISLIDEDSTRLNGQVSGREFTMAYGHGYMIPESGHTSASPRSYMFVHNDKLHILTAYGSVWSDVTINEAMTPGWLMTVYDGENTPVMTKIRTPRQEFDYIFSHDKAAGLLHVMYKDHDRNSFCHVEVNLADFSYREFFDFGYAERMAPPTNEAIILWDSGDISVGITSVTPDIVNTKVTIAYELIAQNDDLADLMVDYSIGDGMGWKSCTPKLGQGDGTQGLIGSSSGEPHTFVHDMADFDTVGPINVQYRIRTIRQTRN